MQWSFANVVYWPYFQTRARQTNRFSLVETHSHYKALNLSIKPAKSMTTFSFLVLFFFFFTQKNSRCKNNELISAKIEVFYKAVYFQLASLLAALHPSSLLDSHPERTILNGLSAKPTLLLIHPRPLNKQSSFKGLCFCSLHERHTRNTQTPSKPHHTH